MPSALVQHLKEHSETRDDAWAALLQGEGGRVPLLLERCAQEEVDTFEGYLHVWRELLTLFFYERLFGGDSDFSLVKKLKTHSFFGTFQLGRLFEAIFDGRPFQLKQLPNGGALLETGGCLEEICLPRPQMSAELGVLSLLHGLHLGDKSLLETAIRLARSHMQTLDPRGKPFAGLWTGMDDFSYAITYSLNYLLFATAAHLSPWPKFHLMAESQLNHLKKLEEGMEKISPYIALLGMALDKELQRDDLPDIHDPEMDEEEEREIGFATYQGSSLHIACTTSGAYSGVGAISKGPVRIVSMGPCYSPIGEAKTYGIHRSPPLHDTIVRRVEDSFQFNGWTRLVPPEKGKLSQAWMELQVEGSKSRGKVTVRFSESPESLYFAFFVESQKAIVNENLSLQPASLDRYVGKGAEVLFKMGDSSLKLLPQSDLSMQVIPLASGDHFWGANFLVAFEMPEISTPVHWEII